MVSIDVGQFTNRDLPTEMQDLSTSAVKENIEIG